MSDVTRAGERTMVPVWTNPRWLACAVLVWLGCTAVYFLTAPGRIDMIDGGIRYDVTESLIETGKPVVRHPLYFGVEGIDGNRYAFYQLGSTITALPFVLTARWLGDGSLESKQFAFSLTTVPYAAGIVSLLFLIFGRLGLTMSRALVWALVTAFCTLLWPYAGSTFDAVLQAFWLTVAVWAAIEALASYSYRWAVVSAVAFAVLVNIQETYVVLGGCVLATAPLTYASVTNRLRSRVVQIILIGVGVGVAGVVAYNLLRFGNPLDTGRTAVAHPLVGNPVVGLVGLAVSPAKSIFLYSPTCLLAILGLRELMRQAPSRFAPLVACLVIHVALISSLKFWAGEWAWGPRYMVASLPLACIGLPYAWPNGNRRMLTGLVCALGLGVQLLGISVDHQRYYVERRMTAYFWVDESTMYTDSPLLARPFELISVFDGRDRAGARALVPGPLPLSMTSAMFGPSLDLLPNADEWMHLYLVFLVPRPWTLWSPLLPEHQRPAPTDALATAGGLIALASFASLAVLLQSRLKTKR
jgi:hypothetical protein